MMDARLFMYIYYLYKNNINTLYIMFWRYNFFIFIGKADNLLIIQVQVIKDCLIL